MSKKILHIIGGNGEKVYIKSRIKKNELFQILSEDCILLCHNCSREDFCVFFKEQKQAIRETPCPFTTLILKNWLNIYYPIFLKLNYKEKQNLLLWASAFLKKVAELDNLIGIFADKPTLDWFSSYAPELYGHLFRHSREISRLSDFTKNIPSLAQVEKIYFVEGNTEVLFFKGLSTCRIYWFKHLDTVNYEGRDNIKYLRPLLKKELKEGRKIYFIGDGDGDPGGRRRSIQKLVQEGLLEEKNIFIFTIDFELSFPVRFRFLADKVYREFIKRNKKARILDKESVNSYLLHLGSIVTPNDYKPLVAANKPIYGEILGIIAGMFLEKNSNAVIYDPKNVYRRYEIFDLIRILITGSSEIPILEK